MSLSQSQLDQSFKLRMDSSSEDEANDKTAATATPDLSQMSENTTKNSGGRELCNVLVKNLCFVVWKKGEFVAN